MYERLGDVRSLCVGRVNLALNLIQRNRPDEDTAEILRLLQLALADAERLRILEVATIRQILKQLGSEPTAPSA